MIIMNLFSFIRASIDVIKMINENHFISGSQDGLVKHTYTWNIQYVIINEKISHLEVEIFTIQYIICHTPVGICQTGALMKSSLDRDK